MSARFAELMAMSAAQTRDSVAATQQIMEEKKRKDEQRRKEQEERDRRDRELQARLLKKRMEEEQRAEERKRKMEEERQRKEQSTQRREEEHRRNLVYGKDRKSGWGTSGGGGRVRKSRADSDDEDDGGSVPLTREEKRRRKLNADLNKSFSSSRRGRSSPGSQGNRRFHKALPGSDSPGLPSSQLLEARHAQPSGRGNNLDNTANITSVRKQLAALPPTLVRLGTTKRDVRTIDEIMSDLHRKKEAKVLEGDEARKNGDWFGEQKKKKAAPVPSPSPSPETAPSQTSRAGSSERMLTSKPSASSLPRNSGASLQPPERKEPRTKVTVFRPEAGGSLSLTRTSNVGSSVSVKSNLGVAKSSGLQTPRVTSSIRKSVSSSHIKHSRSESYSDSDSLDSPPPSTKRRPAASSGRNDIGSEIWKLFGKDRSRYVQDDVYSDEDDDMEVGADTLRREEARSAKIAKKEDELAADEERRHEEEKRRRKKEKDRKGY